MVLSILCSLCCQIHFIFSDVQYCVTIFLLESPWLGSVHCITSLQRTIKRKNENQTFAWALRVFSCHRLSELQFIDTLN